MRLGVIGFGNMGSSFVKGALASGLFKPKDVMVMDLDGGRMEAARRGGLMTVDSLRGLSSCDAIILSVKPKDFSKLLKQIGTTLDVRGPLFISIAAGLKLNDLEEDLGVGARIVRAMPNIAASVYEAASVYVLNRHSTAKDRDFVQRLFAGVGKAFELKDEAMLDAVTGVSGSGPAYFFLMMEAMESAGVNEGLPKELARSLVAQTCRGSGTLALSSDQSMKELIKAVASPSGTTEEALKVLDTKGFSSLVVESVVAAIEKSKKMSKG